MARPDAARPDAAVPVDCGEAGCGDAGCGAAGCGDAGGRGEAAWSCVWRGRFRESDPARQVALPDAAMPVGVAKPLGVVCGEAGSERVTQHDKNYGKQTFLHTETKVSKG